MGAYAYPLTQGRSSILEVLPGSNVSGIYEPSPSKSIKTSASPKTAQTPGWESVLQRFLKWVVEGPTCSSEWTWELPYSCGGFRTVVFGRRPDTGPTA